MAAGPRSWSWTTRRALVALLQSPERTTTPGPAPRWLGSGGLDRRGRLRRRRRPAGPGAEHLPLPARSAPDTRRRSARRLCRVSRGGAAVQALHAAQLLRPASKGVDAEALHAEARVLGQRLEQLAESFAETRPSAGGSWRPAQSGYWRRPGGDRGRAGEGQPSGPDRPPGRRLRRAGGLGEASILGRRRAALDTLFTVTVLPAGGGARHAERLLRIEPKR